MDIGGENIELKNKLDINNIDKEKTSKNIINTSNASYSLIENGPIDRKVISNIVQINYSTFLKIEVLQRNVTNNEQFTTNKTNAIINDRIEYKVIIKNVSNENLYNVIIYDKININLYLVSFVSNSIGSTVWLNTAENSNGIGGTAVWYDITTLVPGQEEEMVLSSIVISLPNNISNMVTGKYSFIVNENFLNTLYRQQECKREKYAKEEYEKEGNTTSSNIVVTTLKLISILLPDINSSISSINNEAVSFGVIGFPGKIGYTLTNNFWDLGSYNLVIDPLPFKYEIYINGNFIQEVNSNTIYNDTPHILSYLPPSSVARIQLIYYIPGMYNIGNNPVMFNITATANNQNNPNMPATVNNTINLGEINLDVSYKVKPYEENLNLFVGEYYIDVYISKGIRVYDLQLKAVYSPSYILDSAYKDGIKLNINNIYQQNEEVKCDKLIEVNNSTQDTAVSSDGQLIYPMISQVDATSEAVKIQYSYKVLQYKNTPLSVGELMQNKAILSGRTAINMEEKFIIEESVFEKTNGQDLTCAYIDQVFGRCTQYYMYENISIPKIANYIFKEINFENPIIIDNSLSVIPDMDKNQFSKVSYKFNIPYRIIYEGCGCLSEYKEAEGIFGENTLETNIYTPEEKGIEYNIISESIVNNIRINEDKTLFSVCIGVVTSSVGKQSFLVNNLKK